MTVRKLKSKLINLYDRFTAKTATISIGDIVNQRLDIENNQFLLTTRLLDIEDYCERGVKTFNWQNTISRKAYGKKHREQDGNKAFTSLIKSYQDNGYDPSSYFVVDSDLRLLDGNHRMGMNLYYGVDTINVHVLMRKSRNPKTVDWYLKVGLDTEFIKNVTDRYKKIQKKMMETGNVFCAVVPTDCLAQDVAFCAREAVIDRYNHLPDKSAWGGIQLPSRGLLIRFTLHEPRYYAIEGKIYSKRAEEIRAVIQARTETPVVMGRNCLESKMLFDMIRQYLNNE